jgi:hypothetical protein
MFVLDSQKLQPFDILLVRFADTTSADIRAACNSEFSHAAVYIGNNSFIEGVPPVVTLFSAQRYFFPTLDDVRVIRLKAAHRASFDAGQAEQTIRGLAYCNYSSMLLTRIQLRSISEDIKARFLREKRWTGGVVCSTLVALPYYAGGIDISQQQEPFFVHFGDIEQSDFFEEVTTSVFTTTTELDGAFNYFTTAETGSILEKQSAAAKELNTLVTDILGEMRRDRKKYDTVLRIENQDLVFTTWEDIIPLIMRWFLTERGQEIDEQVYRKLVSSGYTTLWFEEVHSHRRLFFPAGYFAQALEEGPQYLMPKEHYETTRTALSIALQHNRRQEKATFHNFSQAPAKTLHALLDMHRSFSDLLQSSVTQYTGIIDMLEELQLAG